MNSRWQKIAFVLFRASFLMVIACEASSLYIWCPFRLHVVWSMWKNAGDGGETLLVWTALGSALTFVWYFAASKISQIIHAEPQPRLTAPLWGSDPRHSLTQQPLCLCFSSLLFPSDILIDPPQRLTGLNVELPLRIDWGMFFIDVTKHSQW